MNPHRAENKCSLMYPSRLVKQCKRVNANNKVFTSPQKSFSQHFAYNNIINNAQHVLESWNPFSILAESEKQKNWSQAPHNTGCARIASKDGIIQNIPQKYNSNTIFTVESLNHQIRVFNLTKYAFASYNSPNPMDESRASKIHFEK